VTYNLKEPTNRSHPILAHRGETLISSAGFTRAQIDDFAAGQGVDARFDVEQSCAQAAFVAFELTHVNGHTP